jgi:putative NADH-flavin reductase
MADLETEVKILQKDLVTFQTILDRFDTTISKLTEVSNNLNKVIAVQESKIKTQEKDIEIIHKRISDTQEELGSQLSEHYKVILDKIKELQKEQKIHANEMSTRVNSLEKSRYILIGGSVVLGFLLSKVDFIDKLLS